MSARAHRLARPTGRCRRSSPRYSALVRALRQAALRMRTTASLQMGDNVRFGARSVLNAPNFSTWATTSGSEGISTGDEPDRRRRRAHLQSRRDRRQRPPVRRPETTVFAQGRAPAHHVTLGGDNLIGFGATIVGTVEIGRGCIVGAGALVASDLPPYTVCVGIPARPIRSRGRGAP